MKLQCDVEVVNRMLPTFGMKSRGKGTRAVLSIGKHLDKTSQRSNVYLLICTAKDRAGSKYKVGSLLLSLCVGMTLQYIDIIAENKGLDSVGSSWACGSLC